MEERFYQQLLLSVELYLRVQAQVDRSGAGQNESMLSQLSEKVAWDLALAQVWGSKMTLEAIDEEFLGAPTTFHVLAYSKNIQKQRLKEFAHNMKWVGIAGVERMLEETCEGNIPLEEQSANSATWIAGAILPGESASWLIMSSLIDCDLMITDQLPGFDQMYTNLGFQYRGATFWYWKSTVGKVMGASQGVKQDYGWVGPCVRIFRAQIPLFQP